jgi:GNAT superfamily N-acetyltransferase
VRDWYAAHGTPGRFPGGPPSCLLFTDVYEAIDPGCCIVAEDPTNGRFAGCCFYHPRDTHVSLGIMNAHPDYFGRGVAKALLQKICDIADQQRKPVRLVSSAGNVDSFSLYTRAGFVPRAVYHTMHAKVPDAGLPFTHSLLPRVRKATIEDVPKMANLEHLLCAIRRESDYRYFVENRQGIWKALVIERDHSSLDGFLVSVAHPASRMMGPGVARDQDTAAALILAMLNAHHRGNGATFLVPAAYPKLVRQLYDWKIRNAEIHLCQVRGEFHPFEGISIATFMPETG